LNWFRTEKRFLASLVASFLLAGCSEERPSLEPAGTPTPEQPEATASDPVPPLLDKLSEQEDAGNFVEAYGIASEALRQIRVLEQSESRFYPVGTTAGLHEDAARLAVAFGDASLAIYHLRQAIDLVTDSSEGESAAETITLNQQLAEALAADGQPDAAFEVLRSTVVVEQGAPLPAERFPMLMEAAELARESGNTTYAINAYNQIIQAPASPPELAARSLLELASLAPDQTTEYLEQVLELAAEHEDSDATRRIAIDAAVRLGRLAIAAEDLETAAAAAEAAEKIVNRLPFSKEESYAAPELSLITLFRDLAHFELDRQEYERSAEYLARGLAITERQLEQSPENPVALANQYHLLSDLGRVNVAARKPLEARTALTQALEVAKSIELNAPEDENRWRTRLAIEALADAIASEAESGELRNLWQEAQAMEASALEAVPEAARWRWAQTVSLERLAGIDRRAENLEASREKLEEALDLTEALSAEFPEDRRYRLEQAGIQWKLAGLSAAAGNHDDAIVHYSTALELHRAGDAATLTPGQVSDMASLAEKIVSTQLHQLKQEEAALGSANDWVALAEQHVEQFPEEFSSLHSLASALDYRAYLERQLRNLDRAIADYERIMSLAEKIRALRISAWSIGVTANALGDLLWQDNQLEEARKVYRRGITAANETLKQLPDDLRALQAKAELQFDLGSLESTEGEHRAALSDLRAAETSFREWTRREPDNAYPQELIARVRLSAGFTHNNRGSQTAAATQFNSALEAAKKAQELADDPELLDRLVGRLQLVRGESFHRKLELSSAIRSLTEARDNLAGVYQRTPQDDDAGRWLGQAEMLLARTSALTGNVNGALQHLGKAMQVTAQRRKSGGQPDDIKSTEEWIRKSISFIAPSRQ